MSKVNAQRVPWAAVMVQSIIVVVLAVAIYIVVPYVLPGFDTPEKKAGLAKSHVLHSARRVDDHLASIDGLPVHRCDRHSLQVP